MNKQLNSWLMAMLSIVMVVSFAACGSDSKNDPDSGSSNSDAIVGTWVITQDDDYFSQGESLTFTSSGRVVYEMPDASEGYYSESGTYSLTGNNLVCTFYDSKDDEEYDWIGTVQISGNSMTYKFRWDGDNYNLKLKKSN